MAEIIGLIIFLLCIVVWLIIVLKGITNRKSLKRNHDKSIEKQEEVDSRVRKIEDVYGEKATLIMFQELNIPNICELLVILEEAQIIIILGEAYNFSEILNIKMGQSDYIRLKYTAKLTSSDHLLEQAAAGLFSAHTIKEALTRLEESQIPTTAPLLEETNKIDIMTSRLEEPVISISPSLHTVDEVITALSIIIDKNENKWMSVEIPQKRRV